MTSPTEQFARLVSGHDEDINLAHAALLIAAEEYRDLDIPAYLTHLDTMAHTFKRRLRADISPGDTIVLLNRYLFDEHGFTGNDAQYYDPRNSFLNEVLDRKRGIPLTLSLVYMEIGRRIGLQVRGVAFPAHFLVKCQLREGTVVLDPYAKGASLTLDNLAERIKRVRRGEELTSTAIVGMLAAASNKEILIRMLRNLKSIYLHNKAWDKALSACDRIIQIRSDLAEEYRDRGIIYLNLECSRAALADLRTYLDMLPAAKDADLILQKISELSISAARLN